FDSTPPGLGFQVLQGSCLGGPEAQGERFVTLQPVVDGIAADVGQAGGLRDVPVLAVGRQEREFDPCSLSFFGRSAPPPRSAIEHLNLDSQARTTVWPRTFVRDFGRFGHSCRSDDHSRPNLSLRSRPNYLVWRGLEH